MAGPFLIWHSTLAGFASLGFKDRLRRENREDLARGLPEGAQLDEVGLRCRGAYFLVELTLHCHHRVLVFEEFALGNGPGASIHMGPERFAIWAFQTSNSDVALRRYSRMPALQTAM